MYSFRIHKIIKNNSNALPVLNNEPSKTCYNFPGNIPYSNSKLKYCSFPLNSNGDHQGKTKDFFSGLTSFVGKRVATAPVHIQLLSATKVTTQTSYLFSRINAVSNSCASRLRTAFAEWSIIHLSKTKGNSFSLGGNPQHTRGFGNCVGVNVMSPKALKRLSWFGD